MTYDYIVAGAGFFGAVVARRLTDAGKKVLVVDKRNHIGGNAYTKKISDINVHMYGAHIFHTSNEAVWQYVSRYATFNRYINSPVAFFNGRVYNLPFNMNTFAQMWQISKPNEAKAIIERQRRETGITAPQNLEEQALYLVGRDIYEALIKGYTEKQWGKPCDKLPADIIKRLPLRFIYDNNYFNDRYQGIPEGGYTPIFEKLLSGIEVRLNTDYLASREHFAALAPTVIYTGMIDEYYDYRFGALDYRSLRFESETLDVENYQGNAVVNYTAADVPYTRIIEHKHFEFGTQDSTVITREYPHTYKQGEEPFYPVNDAKNTALYAKYAALGSADPSVIFGGRLGAYAYADMDKTVAAALDLAARLIGA